MAVSFATDKSNCRACEIVLEELEHIDDECDIYGEIFSLFAFISLFFIDQKT